MSFKEFKKRDKLKTWESKIRRLYASDALSEDDIKYLNIQYDLYKVRKSNNPIWAVGVTGVLFIMPLINELAFFKKGLVALSLGVFVYYKIKLMNRTHFENIINPYFEKYNIK